MLIGSCDTSPYALEMLPWRTRTPCTHHGSRLGMTHLLLRETQIGAMSCAHHDPHRLSDVQNLCFTPHSLGSTRSEPTLASAVHSASGLLRTVSPERFGVAQENRRSPCGTRSLLGDTPRPARSLLPPFESGIRWDILLLPCDVLHRSLCRCTCVLDAGGKPLPRWGPLSCVTENGPASGGNPVLWPTHRWCARSPGSSSAEWDGQTMLDARGRPLPREEPLSCVTENRSASGGNLVL